MEGGVLSVPARRHPVPANSCRTLGTSEGLAGLGRVAQSDAADGFHGGLGELYHVQDESEFSISVRGEVPDPV